MMSRYILYAVSFPVFLAVLVFGYLHQFFGKKLTEREVAEYTYANTDTTLKIRYFGTMCYYMEYKGKAILTDPFFSNPNPLKIAIGSKPQEKYLNLFSKEELGKIQTILIGHAHYDHCLELPLFIDKSSPVNILANQSTINLFRKKYPNNHYIKGEDYVENRRWFYTEDSSIRVFFIDTQHGPHFGNTVLMNGENLPQESPPVSLLKWQCGKSMSYIIDFMEQDSIAKRIVFNGGKMNFPAVAADTSLALEHKADMAILLGWNKKELASKYEMIRLFEPGTVLLGHWNNFFNTGNGNHQYIRRSQLPQTLKEVNQEYAAYRTRIMLPEGLKNEE